MERPSCEQEADVKLLQLALDTWELPSRGFDTMVRHLIEEAVYEHEADQCA